MARRAGQKIDLVLVEQAKALHRVGHSKNAISKQMGLSYPTITRYINRPDETPEQVAKRDEEFNKFVDQGWRTLHNYMTILETSAFDEDGSLRKMNPRDAAWVSGVIFDKLATMDARRNGPTPTSQSITFNFISTGENADSEHRDVADPASLPYIEGEVQGDGVRSGGGENVFRLPGSGKNVTGDT